ncbi:MAG: hypothetical protein K9H18_19480 [Rhodospirillum sp.]|nr:hypothetical protein [Rhodospirillum sp.]MCF8500177.1 hypothetical protein [Rhodospirillum sp.]
MRAMILGTAMAGMAVSGAMAASDRAAIAVGETFLDTAVWDEPPIKAALDVFLGACQGLHPNGIFKISAQVHGADSPLKPRPEWGRHVLLFVEPLFSGGNTRQYAVGAAPDGTVAGVAAWGPAAQDRCGWDIRAPRDGSVYFTGLSNFTLPESLERPSPDPNDHW